MSDGTNLTENQEIVSLADEEAVKKVLASSIMGLWQVVNTLTRLRPSKRERYRVAIFGSARAQPGTYVYDEVKRAAAAFAAMGCDIVTGGGPGLMQAANEGAKEAGAPGSVGIRVELHDLHAAVVLAGEIVEDRCDRLARPAPGCPDVDHDGDVGLQHLGLERGIGDGDGRAHADTSRSSVSVSSAGRPARKCCASRAAAQPVPDAVIACR